MSVDLKTLVQFCDTRCRRTEVADFPGAENGLQIENSGQVTRVAAAVDAGLVPFQKAVATGVDFLIVHHGLFWNPVQPITGANYAKLKTAMDGNLAVYSSHLPLDAHPEIGNNRLLANALGLAVEDWFLEHEGTPIAAIAGGLEGRDDLKQRLRKAFPAGFQSIEFGSAEIRRAAILTGSGRSALATLTQQGVDTLITGELRQEHFNFAQEQQLNLYTCGHYATEVFGVKALAAECAAKFGLDWSFIGTDCPL
ncbi:MAG: Nif3-like dinuclear metal center hexameric protein [Opitutales bacterium]|nr:Nif3-like dinuclear metal center hexameric protein [Opitutales bacterium]